MQQQARQRTDFAEVVGGGGAQALCHDGHIARPVQAGLVGQTGRQGVPVLAELGGAATCEAAASQQLAWLAPREAATLAGTAGWHGLLERWHFSLKQAHAPRVTSVAESPVTRPRPSACCRPRKARKRPMPPPVASMMLLGTIWTILPRMPLALMAMKMKPSTNTAAIACLYVTCGAGTGW